LEFFFFQLMVVTLHGHRSVNVPKLVELVTKYEQDLAQNLHLLTEERNVMDLLDKRDHAKSRIVQVLIVHLFIIPFSSHYVEEF